MRERIVNVDEYERLEAEMLLIRVTLGLNPIHSTLACVRTLYEEGREAFERLRGPVCEHAHEWHLGEYKARSP